jgi:Uma2 family endonuclease
MNTLLPIDAITAPRRLVIEPPMTDAEFEEFCRLNEIAQIERTRDGVIHMNPPAGMYTSDGNSEIGAQLRTWWKTHRRGRAFDSSAGFYLPDGSLLSPDAAYLSPERLQTLTKADRKGFPHVCPDFVIELLSPSDRLPDAKEKMARWVENGAQLAWLIDTARQQVFVYWAGTHFLSDAANSIDGDGPVAGFTLDLTEVWGRYED